MEYEAYVARVLGEYRKLVEGDGESCAKKYAVLDGGGKVIHFKGPPGKGVRFKNCVKYFMDCKGLTKEKAQKMCAEIARRKCQAGKRWACGKTK